jgi:single-strand DNA-binding protein
MQILTIAGNVGNVKEARQVGDDSVLNFSLAVDNGKDKNGEKRGPTWYDCAVWGKRATSLQPYITKGTKLALTGRPSARAHDGKAYLGLTVGELTFMGGGNPDNDRGAPQERKSDGYGAGSGPNSGGGRNDMDDEIPFAPCL